MDHETCIRPVNRTKEDKELMKLFSKHPSERDPKKMKEAIAFMKKIRFFSQREIQDEDYLLLMNCMKHVYYPKGHVIYEEGSYGKEFYIVLMGTVTVYISEPPQGNSKAVLRKYKKNSQKEYDRANHLLDNKYEFMKMKPGDAFGETALLNDKPLSESILCSTECHFAVLSKNKFEETLMKIEQNTKEGWKKFYKNHPLFDHLTLVSLEKLFYLVELKMFTRNQKIFKEGDEVKGFYLIYRGEASLLKRIEGNYTENLNITTFMKKKNKLGDDNDKESNELTSFSSLYHSTINNSKCIHKFAKELELRIFGSGQFLGIEDAFLKTSKSKKNYFSNSAVCKSAYLSVFYFDKEKCWEKLNYLGCMDQLKKLARSDFDRVKAFNKQTVNANKTLIEEAIMQEKTRKRVMSSDDVDSPLSSKVKNKFAFSNWFDTCSYNGFQPKDNSEQKASKKEELVKSIKQSYCVELKESFNPTDSNILSSFSRFKDNNRFEYENPLTPLLSNVMMSHDLTNTFCASPKSKISFDAKKIKELVLPDFIKKKFKEKNLTISESSTAISQAVSVQKVEEIENSSKNFEPINQKKTIFSKFKLKYGRKKQIARNIVDSPIKSISNSSSSDSKENSETHQFSSVKQPPTFSYRHILTPAPRVVPNRRAKVSCQAVTSFSPMYRNLSPAPLPSLKRSAFSPRPAPKSRAIPIASTITAHKFRRINPS